uniref:Reverse transcriptase Ty1/copia-type domain-containing protein n=1 Tax=Tanacetum cinerariifolium TaxID=118510 RepID=A0A6L2P6I1_TANCI|nr:hypothetical protein [Tanacetum cinerariifolium]
MSRAYQCYLDKSIISSSSAKTNILKKFDFTTLKTASTPIEPNKALIKDAEAEDVDVHLYRSMIGSLMYLKASRPDIIFAVCACARFQVKPKTSHLHVVKRIFRYIKGQPKLGLWYPRDSPFNLDGFSDSDYVGASIDRKSTTGEYVTASTTEVEYVAAANCCGQTEGSEGFHQIMDFLNTTHIKYALTENPTIYTSHIQQFWQTAAANTLDTGEVQTTATIDGKVKLVSEACIRRHIKLEDSDGINTLPNTEIFEKLSLIGCQIGEFWGVKLSWIFVQMRETMNSTKYCSLAGNNIHRETEFETEDISTVETLVYIKRNASKDKGKGVMTESEPEQTSTNLQQRQERAGYEAAVRLQEQ